MIQNSATSNRRFFILTAFKIQLSYMYVLATSKEPSFISGPNKNITKLYRQRMTNDKINTKCLIIY